MELLEKQLDITPGCADYKGRLGIYETFRAFMDMAAIHAEQLGVGFEAMAARGLFWLTVKTVVNFKKMPAMPETVTLRTWPEAPEKVRANRSYELVRDGETIITGKTEWAVINTQTKRLAPMRGIFDESVQFGQTSACPEPFSRICDEFSEADVTDTYRVRSIDIDVGGHMNNAAYVKALMGCFTTAELDEIEVSRMEVIFRAPCFEGDVLDIYRRSTDTGYSLKMTRGGETVIIAEMVSVRHMRS